MGGAFFFFKSALYFSIAHLQRSRSLSTIKILRFSRALFCHLEDNFLIGHFSIFYSPSQNLKLKSSSRHRIEISAEVTFFFRRRLFNFFDPTSIKNQKSTPHFYSKLKINRSLFADLSASINPTPTYHLHTQLTHPLNSITPLQQNI